MHREDKDASCVSAAGPEPSSLAAAAAAASSASVAGGLPTGDADSMKQVMCALSLLQVQDQAHWQQQQQQQHLPQQHLEVGLVVTRQQL
jgi:hypothetical protein